MKLVRPLALAALALAFSVASAQSSPITVSRSFTASGFGAGAPVDPVTGSFSATFDNAANVTDQTTNVSVSLDNFPVIGTPGLTYDQSFDLLTIGEIACGGDAIDVIYGLCSSDFGLKIDHASTAPTFSSFTYLQSGAGLSLTFQGALTPVSAVPEPATLFLLGLGLTGMGARRWRQRKGA
jgi:hypothetical protein